jgi:hypothetical protein
MDVIVIVLRGQKNGGQSVVDKMNLCQTEEATLLKDGGNVKV